ncbi:ATP-binding cassette domain-containing protein [Marinilactibacillus psychrotolerans]|uniref:ATP-binding cassette domain-containing protein n=1 Tax=Marinilactibacillus psychrotolerans TaxID=191770 RepID=UPI003886AC96
MNPVLTIKGLQVKISNQLILDIKEEIAISSGDNVAVLGENGAGKTTLINAILGEIDFEGEIIKHFQKKDCGIVFQDNAYNDLMKVYELIELVLPLRKEALTHFIESYDLKDLKKKYIKDLSGGEKQRLTLSLVLESEKNIYFFDELTSGLDYKQRLALLAMMKKKTIAGTVLNVTHYFDEIENWATKILMLKQGKLIFFGSNEDFFAKFKHYSVVKVEYNQLENFNKSVMEDVQTADTGDGIAFICPSHDIQANIKETLNHNNVVYSVIKQNVYTSYLMAYATNEKSNHKMTEVKK